MIARLRRHAIGVAVAAVVAVVLFGGAVAVTAALPQVQTDRASQSLAAHSHPQPSIPDAPVAARTPGGLASAAVVLATQDLTPTSHLGITASGYLSGEQLD